MIVKVMRQSIGQPPASIVDQMAMMIAIAMPNSKNEGWNFLVLGWLKLDSWDLIRG